MLKDYLKDQGSSVYEIARRSGISYSTLNDISNGKVNIDNCRYGLVKSLAAALDISTEELDMICTSDIRDISTSYGVNVRVSVRNKSYYMDFTYNGVLVERQLCRVNEDTTYYIRDIARWRAEGYIRKQRMERQSWNTF